MLTDAKGQRTLRWMCVLIAVNQLGFGGIIPVMPLYAESFGVTATAIGAAVAFYGLARVIIAMPTGQLCDRLGRRPTLALGGLVSAVGNLWCAQASSFEEFILARFISGAGAGLVLTAGQVVLADISKPASRARMMAIYQGVFLFAVGIGPLPGGWFASQWGLAAPFYAYTVAALVAGAVAFFAVPETGDLQGSKQSASSKQQRAFAEQINMLMRKISFVLAGLVSFVNAFTRTGVLFAVVPLFGAAQLGLSTTEIGLSIAAGSVAGLVVTYPAGAIADRLGRKLVIVPTTILTGLSYLLYCWAPSFVWFLAASLAWGVAAAASGAVPAAYAADLAPRGMNAAAMSLFRLLADLGYVIGPIAMGILVDWHSAEMALIFSAVMLIGIAAVFAAFAPETRVNKYD